MFGFEPLAISAQGITHIKRYPAWIMSEVLRSNKQQIYRALRMVYRALSDSASPMSLFELTAEVNRNRQNRIARDYVRFAIKICEEIERTTDDRFQIKLEYLPSLADKAYRILRESDAPMHVREILRKMNHRLVAAGMAKAETNSVVNQMAVDSRFAPIGRSGEWNLSEWERVHSGKIVQVMEEFFHLNQSAATANEIYEYVRSKRPDASKNSVASHLWHAEGYLCKSF